MKELAWGWPEICITLFWKLAPNGVTITREDLGRLPLDRVLIEDREADRISFGWKTPAEAQALRDRWPKDRTDKPGLSELQGRWQKIACVLLWKLSKDKTTVITPYDRDCVPGHLTLYTEGHAEDVLFRFMPRDEAQRMKNWHEFHEGKSILERVGT